MVEYKDMTIKVVGKRISPTKMKVKAGEFEIMIDKVGGGFPSPLDYTLASLAGCINIVGTLVAKDMGINIEDIEIEVEGVFNPGKLYGKGTQRAGYKEIKVKVKVKTDADEETLEKWLKQVEERCPISDNLANPTPTKVEFEKF
ncbi:osmotically inducible protein C [Thermococcus sp. EP1]|uniref:OsmC family protein n=1 Tax=Thermococcus sp. EP1 TaxID=1591054 RepID=UPI0006DA32F7|nr:OsmC family protein [Thermococcus sp. EP1]KPU63422.1 osmotically inducible protein C [Thermococcus sp. EP1]